jgi:hypothetical protein
LGKAASRECIWWRKKARSRDTRLRPLVKSIYFLSQRGRLVWLMRFKWWGSWITPASCDWKKCMSPRTPFTWSWSCCREGNCWNTSRERPVSNWPTTTESWSVSWRRWLIWKRRRLCTGTLSLTIWFWSTKTNLRTVSWK